MIVLLDPDKEIEQVRRHVSLNEAETDIPVTSVTSVTSVTTLDDVLNKDNTTQVTNKDDRIQI